MAGFYIKFCVSGEGFQNSWGKLLLFERAMACFVCSLMFAVGREWVIFWETKA